MNEIVHFRLAMFLRWRTFCYILVLTDHLLKKSEKVANSLNGRINNTRKNKKKALLNRSQTNCSEDQQTRTRYSIACESIIARTGEAAHCIGASSVLVAGVTERSAFVNV
jgi:hypothetical protein